MGLSYKENVPDIMESPMYEIVEELNEFEIEFMVVCLFKTHKSFK